MKKGQLYLFTGIILLTFLMAIVIPRQSIPRPSTSFKSLCENYLREEAIALNHGIGHGNPQEHYDLFVEDFIAYARSKDPSFSLVYVLVEHDTITINNGLEDTIDIALDAVASSVSPGSSTSLDVQPGDELVVTIGDTEYDFTVNSARYQTAAIFYSASDSNIRVKVKSL